MRLVTRGDLDGLVSAVLITTMEDVDAIELIHPQHITDNVFEVQGSDVLVNLPYHHACGMWFDHHEITESNERPAAGFRGRHAIAPSAARVVYDHYASDRLKRFAPLVAETDRFDSAALSREDVDNAQGVILLGFLIDPRTSLGAFKVFFKSLLERLKKMEVDEVLAQPDVAERVALYRDNTEAFKQALREHSRVVDNVVITDFRGMESIPVGNRFAVYSLYPECNVSIRLQWGPRKNFVAATLGYSIFNRTCLVNIGELCSDFGGGGHQGAGSCPLEPATADINLQEIVEQLVQLT